MKIKILLLSMFIILAGFFNPVFAVAPPNGPSATDYTLLAPLPGAEASFDPTSDGALGKYINLIIKLVIGISAVLAVVMIVMGGIEYMGSELISSKESGIERIQNAILGLLIALGAYALLNTINPDLLKSDIKIDDAVVIVNIEDSAPQPYNSTTGLYKNGILKGTPLFGPTATLPPFATVNKGECTHVGQDNCTSTRGLNVSQLWAINQGCGCNLVITGGTEWWLHGGQSGSTSHQQGGSTMDLRTDNNPNSPLNKFLSGGKPLVKYTRYPTPNGPYYYEGNHWHIGP